MKDLLLLHLLPFCYGAATRLPFPFAGLHALHVLQCKLPLVSMVLGCYQVFRVLGNGLVPVLGPRTSLPLGAASGLLGYYILGLTARAFDTTTEAGMSGALVGLMVSLAMVGLSEQIVPLQEFCKMTYSSNPTVLRQKYLMLYATNVLGTCLVFLASGIVYTWSGLAGVSIVGMSLEAVLLLGSVVYLSTGGPAAAGATAGPGSKSPPKRAPSSTKGAANGASAADPASAPLSPFGQVQQQQQQPAQPAQQQMEEEEGGGGCSEHALPLLLGRVILPCCHPTTSVALDRARTLQQTLERTITLAPALCSKRAQTGANMAHLGYELQQLCSCRQVLQQTCCRSAAGAAGPNSNVAAAGPCGSKVGQGPSQVGSSGPVDSAGVQVDKLGQLFEEAEGRAPWINYIIALTFAVQAVMIGVILSCGPLYVGLTLKLGVLHVGLVFGAGEALGSAALISTSCGPGAALLRRLLPMPLSLLAVLAVLGWASVLLPVTSSPVVCLGCLVIIMGLNDVGTSLSGECQGNTLPPRYFRQLNTLGNMLRRAGNTCTCILGPLLYQLNPGLPFALFGATTILWAVMLGSLFARRARELTPVLEQLKASSQGPLGEPGPLAERGELNALLGTIIDLGCYTQHSFVSMEQAFWARQDSWVGRRGGPGSAGAAPSDNKKGR